MAKLADAKRLSSLGKVPYRFESYLWSTINYRRYKIMKPKKYILLPCPFCGAKADFCSFNYDYGTVTVGCTNEDCDITMGKGFFSNQEAADHWNRRA